MQPPAPRRNQPGAAGDADTVLLNTRTINRATRSATGPWPAHPSRPYPPAPAPASTSTHDLDSPHARDDADEDTPKFALTSTQVVASMSAAVVAAFIGAQLGVAGTIVGAAIASVISVVGSAVIGHSLLLTRRKVTQTVHHVRGGRPVDDAETALLTVVTREVEIEHAGPSTSSHRPAGHPKPKGWWSRPGRLRWMLVGLAASVAVFAGALGAVTVVEAVTGSPISGGSSGFSVLGGDGGGDDSPTTTAPSSGSSSSSTSATTEPSTTSPTTATPTTATTTAPTTGSSGASTTAPSTTAPTATSTQPGAATSAAANSAPASTG